MSAFEYNRRQQQAARVAAEDPAVLLLEAATMLVDIGTALTTIAKQLHREREPATTTWAPYVGLVDREGRVVQADFS